MLTKPSFRGRFNDCSRSRLVTPPCLSDLHLFPEPPILFPLFSLQPLLILKPLSFGVDPALCLALGRLAQTAVTLAAFQMLPPAVLLLLLLPEVSLQVSLDQTFRVRRIRIQFV